MFHSEKRRGFLGFASDMSDDTFERMLKFYDSLMEAAMELQESGGTPLEMQIGVSMFICDILATAYGAERRDIAFNFPKKLTEVLEEMYDNQVSVIENHRKKNDETL